MAVKNFDLHKDDGRKPGENVITVVIMLTW